MTLVMDGKKVTARTLYIVVEETDIITFTNEVQGMMDEGWRTVGGISVAVWHEQQEDRKGYTDSVTHFIFHQAMEKVTYDPSPSPPPPTE